MQNTNCEICDSLTAIEFVAYQATHDEVVRLATLDNEEAYDSMNHMFSILGDEFEGWFARILQMHELENMLPR